MKRSSTIFLQVVIVLIGIGALAFVLLAPQKNAGATLFEEVFQCLCGVYVCHVHSIFRGALSSIQIVGIYRSK